MILYHYTTAAGLRGIVRTKSIWASDYRFLNDASEFNYGLSIFDRILKEDFSTWDDPAIPEMIGNFRKAASNFSVLIASFCQHSDLLSQWKGYNGAVGYAIGFNNDWLNQNAEEQGFRLFPVCYDSKTQRHLVQQRIGLLRTLLAERREPRTPWEVTKEWWAQMLLTITALKSEHFKEEDEYRLVRVGDGWPVGICTRAAGQGLVPYKPVKLDAKIIEHPSFHRNNVGIESIVVGPALLDQQWHAVDALLASQHMRVQIAKSVIPFLPR